MEDVSAHDANAVRQARAVGFQQALFGGLQVGGRYERGVRHPLDLPSSLTRDSGGLFGQLVRERFRVDGRAELRRERGTPVRGVPVPVDRVQAVGAVALAAEALLREDLSLSGRVNSPAPWAANGWRSGCWRARPAPHGGPVRSSSWRATVSRASCSQGRGPRLAIGRCRSSRCCRRSGWRMARRWRPECTRAAEPRGARRTGA